MIHIIDDYYVVVDEYCYALVVFKGKMKKSGKGIETPQLKYIGYYASLDKAVEACRLRVIRDNLKDGQVSLGEAVATMKSVTEEFNQILKECMNEGEEK